MNPRHFEWTNHAEPTVNVPFTALVGGRRIPILPVSDEVAGCDMCARQIHSATTTMICGDFPSCSSNLDGAGVTFMEDTPENRVKYTAALITGKPMIAEEEV